MTREKRASAGLVAVIVIVIAVIAVVAYYFLNTPPSNPPNPEAKLIDDYGTFEGSQYVYKIFAEVTNNGGEGTIKVFAEKKQYDQTKTLDYTVYMANNETKVLEFTFGLDPYVKDLPSAPTPTPTPIPDPDAPLPEPPPISCRVWTEPD